MVAHRRLKHAGSGAKKRDRLKKAGHVVTKSYRVFKYNELSKDAREKARSNAYEMVDLEPWADGEKESLASQGFNNAEVRYSLGYSQGDGASFTSKDVDVGQVVKSFKELAKYKDFVKEHKISVTIDSTTTQYVHENTTRATVEIYDEEDTGKMPSKRVEHIVDEFDRDLNKVIHDINVKIGKEGYQEIEYQTSDEYVADMSEANNWEYLEDGKIFR